MLFRCWRLQFLFTAEQRLEFASGKPANMLRGALGYALQPYPERYQRVFAPKRLSGPSGLTDAARPFVFRAAHLDGALIQPGSEFSFGVHVFDAGVVGWIQEAFAAMAKRGLGPRRSAISLQDVAETADIHDLDAPAERLRTLRIEFVTATELKMHGRLAERPEFGVLLARARDRMSELSALYGDGPLPLDFSAIGERAAAVAMPSCEIQHIAAERFSTRTGQSHALNGFTGWAEYEGNLGEFIPLLRAAQFTGVGRQTTWGKGEIRVQLPNQSG